MAASGRGSFESSLVDLMTSLAVIFILLLVVFLKNSADEASAIVAGTEDDRSQIVKALAVELTGLDPGIGVKSDPSDPLKLIVVLPEELLRFEKNRSEVPATGVGFLVNFAPKLAGVVCGERFADRIDGGVIEGHTDSTGNDEINIPLSAQRATSVMLEVRKALLNDPEGKAFCFLQRASASGRGSTDLVRVGDEEDHQRSRRVLFKIRVKSAEQRQAERTAAQVAGGQLDVP